MKAIWFLAIAALAVVAIAASRPAGSGQTTDCGAAFEIRDPALRARFAELDRTRNTEMTQVCAVYREDLSARRQVASVF